MYLYCSHLELFTTKVYCDPITHTSCQDVQGHICSHTIFCVVNATGPFRKICVCCRVRATLLDRREAVVGQRRPLEKAWLLSKVAPLLHCICRDPNVSPTRTSSLQKVVVVRVTWNRHPESRATLSDLLLRWHPLRNSKMQQQQAK